MSAMGSYSHAIPERCFACNRPLRTRNPKRVDTRDAQVVYVGADCFKLVVAAGEGGYQPPLGGPRLFVIADQPATPAEEPTASGSPRRT